MLIACGNGESAQDTAGTQSPETPAAGITGNQNTTVPAPTRPARLAQVATPTPGGAGSQTGKVGNTGTTGSQGAGAQQPGTPGPQGTNDPQETTDVSTPAAQPGTSPQPTAGNTPATEDQQPEPYENQQEVATALVAWCNETRPDHFWTSIRNPLAPSQHLLGMEENRLQTWGEVLDAIDEHEASITGSEVFQRGGVTVLDPDEYRHPMQHYAGEPWQMVILRSELKLIEAVRSNIHPDWESQGITRDTLVRDAEDAMDTYNFRNNVKFAIEHWYKGWPLKGTGPGEKEIRHIYRNAACSEARWDSIVELKN